MLKTDRGLLIVLSGPSGAGKGTVRSGLREIVAINYSVSATTRAPRPGETEGEDYFFMSSAEFEKMISENEFLEWAKVYDNYYGTPAKFVEKLLREGQDCILEIDTQGAEQIKKNMPGAVMIFIAPPSLFELEQRILRRGTESSKEIKIRMSCAKKEMECVTNYDYIVVNEEVESSVKKVLSIINAEKCSVRRILEDIRGNENDRTID